MLGDLYIRSPWIGQERHLGLRIRNLPWGRIELQALSRESLFELLDVLDVEAEVIELAALGRSEFSLTS